MEHVEEILKNPCFCLDPGTADTEIYMETSRSNLFMIHITSTFFIFISVWLPVGGVFSGFGFRYEYECECE